ncbi:helix-turn-helix domain-containing protein [Solwaraspora sp. WMMD406]|uniref:helix-turn-helix domain-containing protein n=1 Tax=Solwaraspora sp. WMMD406 TaxID=3016095 RepID=UPI002417937A|nr:helix-turn-helix domain-containing protein [Solwaraspora sp. WMMD406]MDG4762700.1 helix-turn-helix domain-containing protein [Solwaraspora sp. WMMD406]
MSSSWLSVEQVADRLDLHVRTVRGYIRDGRLPAVRIGKQYRIAPADLDAFTGRPAGAVAAASEARTGIEVSAIVDVDAVSAGDADRLSTLLVAGSQGGVRESTEPPLRLQTAYDPTRQRLKIILFGGLASVTEILSVIDTVTRSGSGMFQTGSNKGAGSDG